MYDVKYMIGGWWIIKDGSVLTDLCKFKDPITPRIIIEEIEKDGEI